jgi:hypothetical protein
MYICDMKKILITLTFVFSFLISFAQEISVAKSTRLSFGNKNEYTGEFKFGPFKDIDEVFVLIEENKISINSKVQQFYQIDSAAIPLDDMKGNYWYALDNSGTKCRVYLYMDKFSEIFFAVEYNDYSWIYNIKPVK